MQVTDGLQSQQNKPLIEWEKTERVKPPWVPIKHGEVVNPQMNQKSNNDLADNLVLQPRDEPVGVNSMATPISGRHDTGHGAMDDPSGRLRTQSNKLGISL